MFKEKNMNVCKLLNIEMPIHKICPASKKSGERFICYKDCGFSPLRDPDKRMKINIKKKIQTKISRRL